MKEIESFELARRKTQPVPMDLSAMGSQDQKFHGNCSWCGIYGHVARDCRKKNRILAIHPNNWMVWHGRQRQGQARQRQGQRQEPKQRKGLNTAARQGRKEFTKWRSTTTRHPSQDHTEWTDTNWDHADKWNDAGWWTSDWSTDLWADLAWEQAAGPLAPPQPSQEQSNPTHGGSISMSGGLSMCELSFRDERQHNENEEEARWNENELTDCHKNWHEGILDTNWIPNNMTYCYRRWDENWIQNKTTGCHRIWNRAS